MSFKIIWLYYHNHCWLRKDCAEGNIEYYDYFKRKLRALKEEGVDLTVKRNRDLFLEDNEKKYIEALIEHKGEL